MIQYVPIILRMSISFPLKIFRPETRETISIAEISAKLFLQANLMA